MKNLVTQLSWNSPLNLLSLPLCISLQQFRLPYQISVEHFDASAPLNVGLFQAQFVALNFVHCIANALHSVHLHSILDWTACLHYN